MVVVKCHWHCLQVLVFIVTSPGHFYPVYINHHHGHFFLVINACNALNIVLTNTGVDIYETLSLL